MANLIPWEEFEKEYAQNFSEEMGAPAKPFRIALGALIIRPLHNIIGSSGSRVIIKSYGEKQPKKRSRIFSKLINP
jgi:hypothetical protein